MKKIFGVFLGLILISCSSVEEESCFCNYPEQHNSYVEGISEFTDIDSGIECSKKCGKPIFLSIISPVAASTKKMESQIFTQNNIFNNLNKNFVIVNLYVDDKTKLPENEIHEWTLNGKTKLIETIGDKNLMYQAEKYNKLSQPQYLILSSTDQSVIDEFGYLSNSEKVDSILSRALMFKN